MTRTCKSEDMEKMLIESDILDKIKYNTSRDDLKIIRSFSRACKNPDVLVGSWHETRGCS